MSRKEIDLEQEHDLNVPAPFDPHVASVNLRTGSNSPSDFFDLLVSASFGSEYVLLQSGEDTIEVFLEVLKAEARFDPVNCSLHLLQEEDNRQETWQLTEIDKTSSEATFGAAARLLAAKAPSGSAEMNAQASMSKASESTGERFVLPWRVVDSDTIQFGYPDSFDRPIQGKILSENVFIRSTPLDHSAKVGILARIRVRERWIRISEAQPKKVSKKLAHYWEKVSKADAEGERRRYLFGKLLAHLITIGLQEEGDETHATLAASAIVFSPLEEQFIGVQGPNRRRPLKIDPSVVEKFLESDESQAEALLDRLGVQHREPNDSFEFDVDTLASALRLRERWLSMIYQDFPDDLFDRLISHSFGTKITTWVEGSHFVMSFSGENYPPKPIDYIADQLNRLKLTVYIGDDIGLYFKGDKAHRVAKAIGYTGSYRNMQKALRGNSIPSSKGYLFTAYDLSSLEGVEFDWSKLEGHEIKLKLLGKITA